MHRFLVVGRATPNHALAFVHFSVSIPCLDSVDYEHRENKYAFAAVYDMYADTVYTHCLWVS